MNNILWIVKRKLHKGYDYPFTCETRQEAREIAKYYNGFSHGTKDARYKVKKYWGWDNDSLHQNQRPRE